MNADKVRGDNQTGITKGISLTEGLSDLSSVSFSPLIGREHSPKNANKKVTLQWAPPPSNPSIPHLTLPAQCPSPIPPSFYPLPLLALYQPSPLSPSFSPSCLTACCDPSCTSWSPQQTLGVWRRSGVQAWLRLHPSLCTEEACPAGL